MYEIYPNLVMFSKRLAPTKEWDNVKRVYSLTFDVNIQWNFISNKNTCVCCSEREFE